MSSGFIVCLSSRVSSEITWHSWSKLPKPGTITAEAWIPRGVAPSIEPQDPRPLSNDGRPTSALSACTWRHTPGTSTPGTSSLYLGRQRPRNTWWKTAEVELGLWVNPTEFVLPCTGTHPSTSVCLSGSHTHSPKCDWSPVKSSTHHSLAQRWGPQKSSLIAPVGKINGRLQICGSSFVVAGKLQSLELATIYIKIHKKNNQVSFLFFLQVISHKLLCCPVIWCNRVMAENNNNNPGNNVTGAACFCSGLPPVKLVWNYRELGPFCSQQPHPHTKLQARQSGERNAARNVLWLLWQRNKLCGRQTSKSHKWRARIISESCGSTLEPENKGWKPAPVVKEGNSQASWWMSMLLEVSGFLRS